MNELIEDEAKFIFEQMRQNVGNESYQYWQGRLDSLAWVRRHLPEQG